MCSDIIFGSIITLKNTGIEPMPINSNNDKNISDIDKKIKYIKFVFPINNKISL